MDGCLDETGALAFVAGEISAAARAAIEDHVDTCPGCRTLLATILQSELADPFAPGRRVGRYVVRERIGRGATGVVYRADDLELYRPVALKRLAGHSRVDRDATARLVREARAAAQLSHPNVVTIYEVGDADGEAFIAMEFVDGVTLAAWRRAAVRRWRDVVDVFAQAGRGLAAAHANGLVHRDFKPDNVLIDPSGRARVADFGLARSAGDASRGTAGPPLLPLTASGVVVGTPAYLAPEVMENGVHDARSDQYAFAASLYEALHGRLPLERGGRVEREIHVPRWLEGRIARGLAAEPSERWPDVAAMIDAITRPPRWRVVVSLIGATAIAIVAIVAIAFGTADGDPCAASTAGIDAAWNVSTPPKIAAALGPDLERTRTSVAALAGYAETWRRAAHTACATRAAESDDLGDRRRACLDRARQRFEALVGDVDREPHRMPAAIDELPEIERCGDAASLLGQAAPPATALERALVTDAERALARSDAARDGGRYADAEAALAEAATLGERARYPAIRARVELARVELAFDAGDARAATEHAMAAWATASAVNDRELALDAQLAMLRAQADANPKAIDTLYRPLVAAVAGEPEGGLRHARLEETYGYALIDAGRYSEAEAEFRKARNMLDRRLPAGHSARARAAFEVGAALVLQRRAGDAIAILDDACAALARTFSPYRREVIQCENTVGLADAQLGKTDAAIAHLRVALASTEHVFGTDSLQASIPLGELATALSDADRDEEAATAYRRVVEIRRVALGEGSSDLAAARVNLGVTLKNLGRLDEAARMLDLGLAGMLATAGPDHVSVAIARVNRVGVTLQQIAGGAAADAAAFAKLGKALDEIEAKFVSAFGADGSPVALVASLRAELHRLQGHRALALAEIDRAIRLAVAAKAAETDIARYRAIRTTILGR